MRTQNTYCTLTILMILWFLMFPGIIAGCCVDPIAKAKVDKTVICIGDEVIFSDNGSWDPDGSSIISYKWDLNNNGDFDDEEDGSGTSVSHTFTMAGTKTVTLQVTDNDDNECCSSGPNCEDKTGTDSVQVTVVEVESLIPDEGTEIDDGDTDPNTKEYVVCAADEGFVTVTADANPDMTAANLPACWSLVGGSEQDKLHTKISKTSPGTTVVLCSAGDSYKQTTINVVTTTIDIWIEENWQRVDNDPNITVLKGTKYTFRASLNPEISPWPSDLFSWSGAGSGTDPNIVLTFDTEGSETLTANFAGCSSETININILEPTVYTIGFGGDHTMYETPDPNVWENGKTLISDPVYVNDAANSKNDSVCVTKNSSSIYLHTVKLKVSEDLSFATPIVVDARGTVWWNEDEIQISGLVSEEAELDIKEDVINKIKKYDNNFQIEWRYKVPSAQGTSSWYDIETTNHTLYVTYGTPEPNCTNSITEKRIDFVCKAANDRISISNAAIAVHDALKPESAEPNGLSMGPEPIWLIHNGEKSQCGGLAIYINAHFMMLGLGEGEIRYCYAKADGTCDYDKTPYPPYQARYYPVSGHDPNTNHFDLRNHEVLVMFDSNLLPNDYEATCYLSETYTYYALIGDELGRWSSPADVVTSLFYMLWFYMEEGEVPALCTEVPWVLK